MILNIINQCFPLVLALYAFAGLGWLFQKKPAKLFFLWLGFGLHSFFLINRGFLSGAWFLNPVFEESFFLPWSLAMLYLVINLFSKNPKLADGLLPPILIFSSLAFLFPTGIVPPNPKTQTLFSSFFFLLEVLSHACFISGSALAILYLKQQEPYRLFHSFLVWGFIFYSLAQVVGAYWAYLGWATPLHWSNRHLQSASLWCFYAALLHLRYLPVWNLRTEARFSMIGLLLILLYGYGGPLTESNLPARIGG